MELLGLFLYTVPFWIPVLIGLALLVKGPTDELTRMAGWLTLKPIIATPMGVFILWGLQPLFDSLSIDYSFPRLIGLIVFAFLSILPGAGLTVLTVHAFKSTFSGPSAQDARLLLRLDCVRWLNNFLLVVGGGLDSDFGFEQGACVFALVGLAMPTIFAVVAYAVTTPGAERRQPERYAASETSGQRVSLPPAEAGAGAPLPTSVLAQAGRVTWIQWVLANALGWAVGSMISQTLVGAFIDIVSSSSGSAVGLVTSGVIGGASVGVMQWFILRRWGYRAGWWVLASTLGWTVGQTLRSAIRPVVFFTFGDVHWIVLTVVSSVVAGAVVGGAQWFVLRRRVCRAGWWVLANAVGWAVGEVVYMALMDMDLVGDIFMLISTLVGGVFGAIVGAVIGGVGAAVTGIPLVWLLQRSVERRFQ